MPLPVVSFLAVAVHAFGAGDGVLVCALLFFYCFGVHRDLHSFPTRRSSDLPASRPRPRPVPIRVATSRCRDVATRMGTDRKSTRLNSSHRTISYAGFCVKKKNNPLFPLQITTENLQRAKQQSNDQSQEVFSE